MKKIVLSVLVVLIFAAYIFLQRKTANTNVSGVVIPQTVNNPPSGGNSTPQTSGQGYKNGTYTGDVVDAIYGNVQVQVVVAGGKITDVQFLQYPNSGGHTSEVNSIAVPLLKSEAIQAQSAMVDVVSGATQTSAAFIQSLQSALNQAKI